MIKHSPQITARFVALIITVSFLTSYILERSMVRHSMSVDARKISNVISENLDQVNSAGVALGKKIVQNGRQEDVHYIENLLKDSAYMSGIFNRSIPWGFSWNNRKSDVIINTVSGAVIDDNHLATRSYVWDSKNQPWKLQFSKPDNGIVSNNKIIPAAIGVTDNQDRSIAMIIVEISLKALISKVEAVVHSDNAFMVVNRDISDVDDQEKLVFSSSNTAINSDGYKKVPLAIKQLKTINEYAGKSPLNFKIGRYKYDYYKLIDGYPFVVFMGFDLIKFWLSVFCLAIQIIISLMAITLLFQKLQKVKL